jgi:pyruvyltransferase
MPRVELVHWNPRRALIRGPLGRRLLPYGPRRNNFGDLLGPIVVKRLLATRGIDPASASGPASPSGSPARQARLLTVGSVMHFAHDGDTVWGTGVNGKMAPEQHDFESLDVRAVRGPVTREFLEQRGIRAPAIYGDPALLLADLDPRLREWAAVKEFDVAIVPNMHDFPSVLAELTDEGRADSVVDPRSPVDTVLERIARSRLVVGSSLHGIVIAESLGIPARLVAPSAAAAFGESPFKYDDYYAGTGRAGAYRPAADVAEALELGGDAPPDWDLRSLLDAFPWDLWSR